jgi:hypothetical protein
MPKGDGYGGRRAQAWVAAVLGEYGDRCHLCRHGQADSADHLTPRSTRPDLMFTVANGRPAHHKPCPTCGIRCNNVRKDAPLTQPPPVDSRAFFERTP